MSSDQNFLDDMQAAARRLRAAVSSALTQGVSPDDIERIVEAGIADVQDLHITRASLARAASLDVRASGEPVPAPRLSLVPDAGRPGTAYGYVPTLHPAVGRTQEAA